MDTMNMMSKIVEKNDAQQPRCKDGIKMDEFTRLKFLPA
jgi:hypothetical protein